MLVVNFMDEIKGYRL